MTEDLIKSNIKKDFDQLQNRGRNYSYNFNIETTINTDLNKSKAKERQTFQKGVDILMNNIEESIQLEDESIQLEDEFSNFDMNQNNNLNPDLNKINEKISNNKKNDLFETFNENLKDNISASLYPNTENNKLTDKDKKIIYSKNLKKDSIYSNNIKKNFIKELTEGFDLENQKESISRVNSINKRNSADNGFIKKSRFISNKKRNSYASMYSHKFNNKNKI